MNEERAKRIDGSTLTSGLVLIGIGVLFLLSRLGIADFGEVIRRYWPMIIILAGVPKLFSRDTMWSGLWLIAVGIWLQVAHLRLFGLSYSTSWPLLLIALGGGMMLRALMDPMWRKRREERHER